MLSLVTAVLIAGAIDPPSDVMVAQAKIAAWNGSQACRRHSRSTYKSKRGWAPTGASQQQRGNRRRRRRILEPIMQIQVPKSVELEGRILKTHRELANAEFLRKPYERVVTGGKNAIRFKLASVPKEGDKIVFNLIAYVSREDSDDSWFVGSAMKCRSRKAPHRSGFRRRDRTGAITVCSTSATERRSSLFQTRTIKASRSKSTWARRTSSLRPIARIGDHSVFGSSWSCNACTTRWWREMPSASRSPRKTRLSRTSRSSWPSSKSHPRST